MKHIFLDFIYFMHYNDKCKGATGVPGKYGIGRRAGKETTMKLTYEEYIEITIALEKEREEAKGYIERFPEDCDFWKKRDGTLERILEKIEKSRIKAYRTNQPA